MSLSPVRPLSAHVPLRLCRGRREEGQEGGAGQSGGAGGQGLSDVKGAGSPSHWLAQSRVCTRTSCTLAAASFSYPGLEPPHFQLPPSCTHACRPVSPSSPFHEVLPSTFFVPLTKSGRFLSLCVQRNVQACACVFANPWDRWPGDGVYWESGPLGSGGGGRVPFAPKDFGERCEAHQIKIAIVDPDHCFVFSFRMYHS